MLVRWNYFIAQKLDHHRYVVVHRHAIERVGGSSRLQRHFSDERDAEDCTLKCNLSLGQDFLRPNWLGLD